MTLPQHIQIPSDTAIVLLNTGSPEELTVKAVREYLVRFLTDKRIINIPKVFRHLLVRGIIAPFRAPKSLEKYRTVWKDGQPILRTLTHNLAKEMSRLGKGHVVVGMRYEKDSISTVLQDLSEKGYQRVILLPLYPHYAMSSFETAVADAYDEYQKRGYSYNLLCAKPYYQLDEYITLMAERLANIIKDGDHLLFSYHGIPVSQNQPYKGDHDKDYEWQCHETMRLIMASPLMQDKKISTELTYQSRLGLNKWLTPATVNRLKALPHEGHQSVKVICPSFICDCLETIEEISLSGRQVFEENGGKDFRLVPCLNDQTDTATFLLQVALNHHSSAVSQTAANP